MSTPRLEMLMDIARRNRVQVHFLDANSFPGLDWDGLYLVEKEMGAGIAIRDNLEPEWRDWILGHELGHHFSNLNGVLFSPFRAHKVDTQSRRRWGKWRKLDPDEERANLWAANTLIKPEEWEAAEVRSPCDLPVLISELNLPMPAAIAWERQRRSQSNATTCLTFSLNPESRKVLERSVRGRGGHQAFFKRIRDQRRGDRFCIDFRDFSYARERLSRVSGGWRFRYHSLLDAVAPALAEVGGVSNAFGLKRPLATA
jgi:hypothetical protein